MTLQEIEKHISETVEILLKLNTVQLVVSYTLSHLAEDLNREESFIQDILFGSRSILEISANIAEERAINTEEFERILRTQTNN